MVDNYIKAETIERVEMVSSGEYRTPAPEIRRPAELVGRFTLEEVAMFAHGALRDFWMIKKGELIPGWLESEEWRNMTLSSMRRIHRNPEMGPEACFMSWFAWATWNGWRYGDRIDTGQKTNPRLRPWEDLGEADRMVTDILLSTYRAYSDRMAG